jgi:hypothetical protein
MKALRDKEGRFVKGHVPWHIGKKGLLKANSTSFKKGVRNNPEGEFKKGQETWNKGLTIEMNEKHWAWKGDDAGYGPKHQWVYRRKGKAEFCIVSSKHNFTRYYWHNLSGEYKRDLEDWISVCPSCHQYIHNGRRNVLLSV